MMKILMISTYYQPYCSGVTEYVRRLSEALVKKGHHVTVLTSRFDKKLKVREDIKGVHVRRDFVLFKLNKGVFMPAYLAHARQESKHHDVIILHMPMMESGLISLLVDKRKIVSTYHCDLNLGKGLLSSVLQIAYNLSAKISLGRSSEIITYTNDYASHSILLKKYLDKCSFIYPPINHNDFSYSRNNFRKKYGIKKSDKVVGFAGRFVYEKGLPYLLQAIPLVVKQYPNAKFILAGEYEKVAGGSIIGRLKQLLKKYENNIILLGHVNYERLSEFYSACDVLALPSIDRLEAFGMVQIEAMYCGTAVIASDLPGVRVPVKRTGMGIIIKIRDEQALARAIVSIFKNKKKYFINKQNIVKEFNMHDTVRSYENLIKKYAK